MTVLPRALNTTSWTGASRASVPATPSDQSVGTAAGITAALFVLLGILFGYYLWRLYKPTRRWKFPWGRRARSSVCFPRHGTRLEPKLPQEDEPIADPKATEPAPDEPPPSRPLQVPTSRPHSDSDDATLGVGSWASGTTVVGPGSPVQHAGYGSSKGKGKQKLDDDKRAYLDSLPSLEGEYLLSPCIPH
jgi:hypothetical protein